MGQRAGPGARAVAAALALVAASVARGAWPQPPPSPSPPPPSAGAPPADEARRTALYHAAAEAAGAGRWAEAKEKLLEALAIRRSPKVLYELGQAEEQLGQVASALGDYERALSGARDAGEGDVAAAAEQARAALAPRVPRVRVVVQGPGAAAASATLDGKAVAVGEPAALDPGAHALVVSAPGARTVTMSVAVREGQQVDVPLRLEPEATQEPATQRQVTVGPPTGLPGGVEDERPATGSPWRTVGLVVAGAGVVGLGVGAGFGLASMSKHSDAQASCPGATCADAGGAALWHDAVVAGNVSTAAFVAGGVLLAGGVVLWMTAPRASDGGAAAQVGVGPGSVQLRGVW